MNKSEGAWDVITEIAYSDLDVWGTPIAGRGLEDVYHGTYGGKGGGKEVAVKKIPTDKLSEEALAQLPQEAQQLHALRHPNIVQSVGFCRPPNCCLLTEFRRVSLQDAMYQEQRELSHSEACGIFADIASGMAYLHKEGVIHYDLTPANVFLDDQLNAKISDFGMRRVKLETMMLNRRVGCPRYLAPELLSQEAGCADSRAVDVYSFGILMAEVLNQEPPFGTMDPIQIASAVLTQSLRPPIPLDTPESIKAVVEAAWAASAAARPTFAELVPRLQTTRGVLAGSSQTVATPAEVFARKVAYITVVSSHESMAAAVVAEIKAPKNPCRIRISAPDPRQAHELGTHANQLQYIKKEYENAGKLYKRALRVDPLHANNLGNYAHLLHYGLRDAEKAAKYYESAVGVEPLHANNLGNYAALLHYMLEDFPKAGEHYERALEVDQHHATNTANYAEYLAYACNEIQKAEEFYTRAIKLNPGDYVLLRKYAAFLRNLKKTEGHAKEVMIKADACERKGGAFFSRFEPSVAPKEKGLEVPVIAKTSSVRSSSSKTCSFGTP